MIRLSSTVKNIIEKNALLRQGMKENILNLSEVARKIHPLVETRVKKEVKISSLVLTLSRLNKHYFNQGKFNSIDYKLKKITSYSGLTIITFDNNKELEEKILTIHSFIKSKNSYITLSYGLSEITVIIEQKYSQYLLQKIKAPAKNIQENIAALGVSFEEKYFHYSGLLHAIIKSISWQNINIWEVSSTFTEFVCYIDSKNSRLCFDTLHKQFMTY